MRMPSPADIRIAYFSMEIAMRSDFPSYAGGLGILAGDMLRSAADMKLPFCAVSLLYRRGYFRQSLDGSGWQFEHEESWDIESCLEEIDQRVSVSIDGRQVSIRCWRHTIIGVGKAEVPVYLLDADVPENSEWDRKLTDRLYLGDHGQRIAQELILGEGGVKMLRALGYDRIERFHMNEGHSAFLGLELLAEEMRRQQVDRITQEVLHAVRMRCVFTTHTPVPAGHDQFDLELVKRMLRGREFFLQRTDLFQAEVVASDCLNMTYLALNLSHYVNGVAKKHAEVSRLMFADYEIDSITNGVHVATWVSPPFRTLYDRVMPGWEKDNFNLRSALRLTDEEVWRAHQAAKFDLLQCVENRTGEKMSLDVLTLGFARRATSYKRPKLLFEDCDRLFELAGQAGGLQLVFAGKAHPGDDLGKFFIQDIIRMRPEMEAHGIKLVYLENYEMDLAKFLVSGVDVWLNTPQPPLEASGTSGMKAALNGIPSLSVLDGWWVEGCIPGVTGWAIEEGGTGGDASALYDMLQQEVVPLYHERRPEFIRVMRHAIALNGSFFTTQRMLLQYLARAYFL